MMIVWNDSSIRWFQNASEYTGYNEKLAQILLEHIPNRNTLCDMGCGAALIDFELAKYISRISCIDISTEAIDFVQRQIREQNLGNISAKCMDGSKAEGEWETVMALFHGGESVFSDYFHMAKDQLILVTHGSFKGGFGPKGKQARRCFNTDMLRTQLDGMGVKYHLQEFELEYGQPFTDMDDAKEFVKAYSMPMSEDELGKYLSEKLEKTDDPRFPYYLPKKKDIGMFVIRRNENEKL